jgi:hypothetical protein
MTSELKSATARANGAKSRGPKSPETRQKSSRNSLTHGFTARHTMVLECEDSDEFLAMVADYVADYQPGSPVEENLVNEMAAARWRTMRLRMIEVAMLDSEINRPHLQTIRGRNPQTPAIRSRLPSAGLWTIPAPSSSSPATNPASTASTNALTARSANCSN